MKTLLKDKRFIIICIFTIVIITFSLSYGRVRLLPEFSLNSETVQLDLEAYGNTRLDTTNLNLVPILDTNVESNKDQVIKVDFTVGGSKENEIDDIIYDIALNDLEIDCSLLSPYLKWKLVKNGTKISEGSFDYKFDTITNGRFILTETQQDLPTYNENKEGYDKYSFYLWISDSCQNEDLNVCKENNSIEDQSALLGKILKGQIEVQLYTGSKKVLERKPATTLNNKTCNNFLSTHIQNLYHDGNEIKTVNLESTSKNYTIYQNKIQKIMLDDNLEYRYYGENPNNYVLFNQELWRIISVANIKNNENDNTNKMRVKIIREEAIEKFSWDSSFLDINTGLGINDWIQSDIALELNTVYYNKTSGNCYKGINGLAVSCDFTEIGLNDDSKALIGNTLWYLGGTDNLEKLSASDYYDFERETKVYECKPNEEGTCPRKTTWVGKVGLIYPSDYAYATDFSVCNNLPTTWKEENNLSCKTNNWLYQTDKPLWTITAVTNNNTNALSITKDGNIDNNQTVATASQIRPVVVLKSNVSITDGDGTKENPYQLKKISN